MESPGPKEREHAKEFYLKNHEKLMELDVDTRWEITRRHPYYTDNWAVVAEPTFRERATTQEWNRFVEAIAALNAIGVYRFAPDPSTEFADLDLEAPGAKFLFATVRPLTLRYYANVLLSSVPRREMVDFANLLYSSVSEEASVLGDTERRDKQRMAARRYLEADQSPWLGLVPDESVYFIQTSAALKRIKEDLAGQVKIEKKRANQVESRTHTSKHSEYLEIWDAREGWSAGAYHPEREQSFVEIARTRKASVATVFSRYKSAFLLITGQELSRKTWWSIVGVYKLRWQEADPCEHPSRQPRRNVNPRTPRDVPEGRLVGSMGESVAAPNYVFEAQGASDDNVLIRQWTEAIPVLIQAGKTNKEIAEELDLKESSIADLRIHFEEFGQLLPDEAVED